MSHHDGLLCYSRGKLCLLNMFLASVDTLDVLFARYGRILWHNVTPEGKKLAIFEQSPKSATYMKYVTVCSPRVDIVPQKTSVASE